MAVACRAKAKKQEEKNKKGKEEVHITEEGSKGTAKKGIKRPERAGAE